MTDSQTALERAQGERDEQELLRRAAMTAPIGRIEAPPARFWREIQQGQNAAHEFLLTHKALTTSARLRGAPEVANELLDGAANAYATVVGRLQAQIRAQIESERGVLEYQRQQRASQRADFVSHAFRDAPPGAIEFFKSQLAQMSDAQKLTAYRRGTTWQELVIAQGFTLDVQRPHDDTGAGIMQAVTAGRSPEARELRQLIAQDQRGRKGSGYDAAEVTLASEEALDSEERALESLEKIELPQIDELTYKEDLAKRYKIERAEPQFDARQVQLRQLSLEREAGQLGAAVPPAVLP